MRVSLRYRSNLSILECRSRDRLNNRRSRLQRWSSVNLAAMIPLIGYRYYRDDHGVAAYQKRKLIFAGSNNREDGWNVTSGTGRNDWSAFHRGPSVELSADEFDYGFWRCCGDGWRGNKHCRSFNNSQWVSSGGHRCYSPSRGFHSTVGIRKSTQRRRFKGIGFAVRNRDRFSDLIRVESARLVIVERCDVAFN